MSNDLTNVFGPLDGAKIPGGCDWCDAHQSIERREGVWHITVHHDSWCRFLRRQKR